MKRYRTVLLRVRVTWGGPFMGDGFLESYHIPTVPAIPQTGDLWELSLKRMSQICRGSRAKALTAAELARQTGISYAAIRDLIHNRTARVDFATLARLM